MDIEIGDTLTLEENKKYIVVSQVVYEDQLCLYLVDETATIPMFAYLIGNELVEIEDENIIRELLPLFVETASPIMEQMLTYLDSVKPNN